MTTPFRVLVTGLADMGAVTLRGQEYSGEYLAMLVAVNPETPGYEAARTPQVISELGRLCAAAYYEKEMSEVTYRVWRDGFMHQAQNDPSFAQGTLGIKGKPTKVAIEAAMRQQDEYLEHYQDKLAAEEVWQTLHAAYDAAKARTWAVRGFESSGGGSAHDAPAAGYDGPSDTRHPGHGDHGEDVSAAERHSTSTPRAPIPAPSPAAGPPGPPPPPSGPPAGPPPPPRG